MRGLLNRRKKNRRLFILIGLFLVLFMSIGYAYLRETLTINSNTEISSMRWDVHFENIRTSSGSVVPISNPTIGSDNLSITTSLEFTQPGQYLEYTVDVKNQGSIDAMIESFEDTILTEEQQKYLIYSACYMDGTPLGNGQLLKAGETEKIKVRIEVKEDLQKTDLPTSGDQVKIKFKINYVQSDIFNRVNIDRQIENSITPGDSVKIISGQSEEDFYVVSSNSEKTVLITKYCLNTNNNQVSDNTYRTINFSNINYWEGKVGLGLSYEGNYYSGNSFPYVYDSNSELRSYVNIYGRKIKNMGITVLKSRLLTKEEATLVSTISSQTYWLGSSYDSSLVWTDIGYTSYSDFAGIRPVIEISTDEIK